MKTSHTATIIFLSVCFSSIQSLSVQKRPCKLKDATPTPTFENGKGRSPITPPPTPTPTFENGKGRSPITPPPAPTPAPYVKPTPSAAPIPISSSKCPPSEGFTSGVSYIRFKAPLRDDNYLQISQVVVNDRSGNNVALRKPATSTGVDDGSTCAGNQVVQPAWAVDGIIPKKCGCPDHIMILWPWPLVKEPFWMVDLQGEFDVKEVYYHNRICFGYRAVGVVVELLDVQKNVIKHYVMQNEQTIYCIPTN